MALKLPYNWLESGLMDLEYKQYKVLAYRQSILKMFERMRLFPYLFELRMHLKLLTDIKQFRLKSNHLLLESPSQVDLSNTEKDFKIPDVMHQIMEFTIPIFEEMLEQGNDLEEQVTKQLSFEEVGINPEQKNEGLLFIHISSSDITYVFEYSSWISGVPLKIKFKQDFKGSNFIKMKREVLKNNSNKFPYSLSCVFENYIPIKDTIIPSINKHLNLI